jgi:tetratricopeptide (TPR) repeat protein
MLPVRTPTAYAVVLGTEFNVAVSADGKTQVEVLDGSVQLTNDAGRLVLTSGRGASLGEGSGPRPTPPVDAASVLQWALHYPAVLDPEELPFTEGERQRRSASLAAYRAGNVRRALDLDLVAGAPASEAERLYRAGLQLAVGAAEAALEALRWRGTPGPDSARVQSLREAVETVANTVRRRVESKPPAHDGGLASELLALSYFHQSRSDLKAALRAARDAVRVDPGFGFAWARQAELELGFGRLARTRELLDRAAALAPEHPEVAALRGYVLAGERRGAEALREFDRAIALDSGLGDAWLGRGLVRIQSGDREGGLLDLQTAVMVEPQRAVLRSYLGKGLGDLDRDAEALRELDLAKASDPADPTAWLYSALLRLRENRPNEAVRDLERSRELNNNRQVYRSRLMLDQDQAVRGVNLAIAYDDAGMPDVARREAARAAEIDPGNHSAHLFLAQSYQRERDLHGINQRYETPAIAESLLASLLSPVGGGTLAQSVSRLEYSRLFDADGLGIASTTEYASHGRWLEQGAQFGTIGTSAYAVSAYYASDPGERVNSALEQKEFSAQWQQQAGPSDMVYVRILRDELTAGDVSPRYDPATANPGLKVRETGDPLLLAGLHHTWTPGSHTLLLGGWFEDERTVLDPQNLVWVVDRVFGGPAVPLAFSQNYRSELRLGSLEAQQIWQQEGLAFIAGARMQEGTLRAESAQSLLATYMGAVDSQFSRWAGYGYGRWAPVDSVELTAGVAYDVQTSPRNFRLAPLTPGDVRQSRLSPKAGVAWRPAGDTTIRFAYTRSLGGVGFEPGIRLEPTTVAGLNQTYRSLVPEAVTGALSGEPMETYQFAVEHSLHSRLFGAVSGEVLQSRPEQAQGFFDYYGVLGALVPDTTRERLRYREESLAVDLHYLVAEGWSLGGSYRLSRARLRGELPDLPAGAVPDWDTTAVLHHVRLTADYNHPAGFFARFETGWYTQSNRRYNPGLPGDDFWQLNLLGGWRFLHRRAELRAGLLNITGRDYVLNPLNLTPDLPRHRMLVVTTRFNF